MKTLGIVVATTGLFILFLSSVVTYSRAHAKAQAFMAAHPEIQGEGFYVVEVPLKSGGTGHLILNSQTGQPTRGHYVLEFDNAGVLETSEQDAVPKTLSAGYFDISRIPHWILFVSIAIFCGGIVLAVRGHERQVNAAAARGSVSPPAGPNSK
jgi:hypothetical protein